MSSRTCIVRPRAGLATSRLLSVGFIGLLALALVGVPTAALAHHHGARTLPADDLSCSLCLWQSHFAAEPAPITALAAPDTAALTPAAPVCHVAITAPSVGAPRAPPASRI
jgi:hypothetical protein